MRLPTLRLLVVVLLVATAGALLGTASLLGGSSAIPAPRRDLAATDASRHVARQFYAALDAALTNGDSSALDALLAPTFHWSSPPLGLTPDRAGLVAYLTALHQVFPDLRIALADLVADGSTVVAWRALRGSPAGHLAGLPVRYPGDQRLAIDRLRIDGERVAELDGLADDASAWQPLGATTLTVAGHLGAGAAGARYGDRRPDDAGTAAPPR